MKTKEAGTRINLHIWKTIDEICIDETDTIKILNLLLDYGYKISKTCKNKMAYKYFINKAFKEIINIKDIDWTETPTIQTIKKIK